MAAAGKVNYVFALTLIAIGVVLLMKEFGLIHGDILRYWPALLIIWGAGMILASRKG